MPVTLRERKPPAAPSAPVAKKSKVSKPAATKGKAAKETKAKATAAVAKADSEEEVKPAPKDEKKTKASGGDSVGDVIDLEGFGGEIETNDGEKTTLKELVEKSGSGVVLFTYPKASTPGCTKQVCFFRDAYTPLTSTGLAIYGLSSDSPKANTTFKTKQNLPYPLLCDQKGTLIKAIGLGKAGGKTTRGVWVVNKEGKVRVSEAGGPEPTMLRIKKLVEEGL